MVMTVVITADIGIKAQLTSQQICYSIIRVAADTTVELNACIRKGHLCTAANAAADQRIYIVILQKARQCAMSATLGVYHLRGYNRVVLDLIKFKCRGVAKVLEYKTCFIGNCDFHMLVSLYIFPDNSIFILPAIVNYPKVAKCSANRNQKIGTVKGGVAPSFLFI